MKIIDSPSPNQNERPAGVRPNLLVLHGTVGTDAGDLVWLTSAKSGVSYHYLLLRTGAIHRLVRPERRAWHAGLSSWEGVRDCNDYSIGIGISNRGPKQDGSPMEPFTDAQYASCAELCATLMRHFPIPLERIVSHAMISPGRKQDPWLFWDWMRLASGILAHR